MPASTGRLRTSASAPEPPRRSRLGPLAPYADALSVPGALGFYLPTVPARLGSAMLLLGVVWMVRWSAGSYAAAGLVAGAFSLGAAILSPQVAVLYDRFGQSRMLPWTLACHGSAAVALITASVLHAPVWFLAVLAVLAGGSSMQWGSLSRARWSHLVGGTPRMSPAFALESLTDELQFVLGPAIVSLVSTLIHPVLGPIVAIMLVLGGGTAFAARRGTAPAAQVVAGSSGGVRALVAGNALRTPGLRVLLVAFVGIGVVFGSFQLAVTATATGAGQASLAGPVYAAFSAASVVAGFCYGVIRWRAPLPTRLLFSVGFLGVAALPLVLLDSLGAIAVALMLPGLALAPTLIAGNALAERLVPRRYLTEAFTWLSCATALGLAGGSAISGQLVDGFGPRWAFGFAAVVLLVGASVATLLRRTLYLPATCQRNVGQ